MINENGNDRKLRPDPATKSTWRTPDTDPDITTVPPRRSRLGIPLLVAAFILVAALAGLILGTPRPATNESIMPTASSDMTEPYIEPAAQGDVDATAAGTATTAPAGVAGTTTADTANPAITPPATVYASEEECEDANNGNPCYMQSCTRTDQIACPADLREGWRPSTVMNGDTIDNTDYNDANRPGDTATTPTNNAIPPAQNPSAPRNDGTISTPDRTDGTGTNTTTP